VAKPRKLTKDEEDAVVADALRSASSRWKAWGWSLGPGSRMPAPGQPMNVVIPVKPGNTVRTTTTKGKVFGPGKHGPPKADKKKVKSVPVRPVGQR
jgi:hypothetical protein